MKRLALCLSMLFGLVSPSYAVLNTGTGTVYLLRSHISGFGADVDWFSLVGVSSLGACKTADAGYVVLKLRDDPKGQRMFTLVLAAKTSGMPLTVWVDDTVTDSGGYCYVLFMQ
jgi:hypothetical protein